MKHALTKISASVMVFGILLSTAAAATTITRHDESFVCETPTIISGTYDAYAGFENAIRANLTVGPSALVRLIGKSSDTDPHPVLALGPANGEGTVTVTVGDGGALLASWKNATDLGDPNKDPVHSYLTAIIGDQGGNAKLVADGFGTYGWMAYSFWFERLRISENATPQDGYFDFLQVNEGGVAMISSVVNDHASGMARILFNGGYLYFWYPNWDAGANPFNAKAGQTMVLKGLNGHPVYAKLTTMCSDIMSGEGTVRIEGTDFKLGASQSIALSDDGTRVASDYYWHFPSAADVDWQLSGDVVLDEAAALILDRDDPLPYGPGVGILRINSGISCTKNKTQALNYSSLAPNGHTVHLNGIVAGGSYAKYSCVTNRGLAKETESATHSKIVLGAGNVDSILAVRICSGVDVEKVGSGTLVVSNAVIEGSLTVKEGRVRFVGDNVFAAPPVLEDGVEVDGVLEPTTDTIRTLRAALPDGVTGGSIVYDKTDDGELLLRPGAALTGARLNVSAGRLFFTEDVSDPWWRFTFKTAARVSQSEKRWSSTIELGSIVLMSSNATVVANNGVTCVSYGLQTNTVEEAALITEYSQLQAGYCMSGFGETPVYGGGPGGRWWAGASHLFDSEGLTVYSISGLNGEGDASLHKHIVLHLADGKGAVSSYGFQALAPKSISGSAPEKWTVESSADGVNWTVRDDHTARWQATAGMSAAEHHALSEYPMDNAGEQAYFNAGVPWRFTHAGSLSASLLNVKIAVAANAVLDASYVADEALSVAELSIDLTTGAGRVTKFRPAANGVLRLSNLPNGKTLKDFRKLPIAIDSFVGVSELSTWRVFLDGTELNDVSVREKDGLLCLAIESGLLILFR